MGWLRRTMVALGVAALLGSCTTADGNAAETARAIALVDATRQAGLAPGLTVDAAIALYGEDAAGFCDLHDDGIDDVDGLVILGNTSQGRRPALTDHAIAYGRLVAEVYCPDILGAYDAAFADVEPFEVQR